MTDWTITNPAPELFQEAFKLTNAFELDGRAKSLPWGCIQESEELNKVLIAILPMLNQFFNAEIKPEDASIVLAAIYDETYHSPYQRIVPPQEWKRDKEGKPLPVRIYIPLNNGMTFMINRNVYKIPVGEIACLPNGHPCEFKGFRWKDETMEGQPTRFLIIDLPPYNRDYDRPVPRAF